MDLGNGEMGTAGEGNGEGGMDLEIRGEFALLALGGQTPLS